MLDRSTIKKGDKVRHKNRPYYQNCVITEVEEGCYGGVILLCQDGFYGGVEEVKYISIYDLVKVED